MDHRGVADQYCVKCEGSDLTITRLDRFNIEIRCNNRPECGWVRTVEEPQ